MSPVPLRIAWLEVNSSYAHASIVPSLLAAAVPAELDVSWTVVRGLRDDDPGELARRVVEAKPDVVGSTLYLFNRRTALDTLARVRALMPECRIAVGGPECLGDNRELLARHPVDAAFRGEGEVGFGSWLQCLAEAGKWSGIPGLCYRGSDGAYHDDGATPRWQGFGASVLSTASALLPVDRPFLQYETARGCAGRCSFCTSGGADTPRPKPLETVEAELAGLRARRVQDLRLLDRTFNLPPSRCVALLRMFREQFPDLRFHLEIHPGLLTEAIRAELAQALPGQLHVEAGVQSLCPEVLARIGRTGEPERVVAGLEFLVSCPQFETHVDLLAGLPGQDLAQVLADATRLTALGAAEIQLELLKILPGTPLRAAAASEGLVFPPVPPYEILRTPQFPERDLARAEKLSRLIDRFYNAPMLQEATKTLIVDGVGLEALLAMAEVRGMLAAPVSMERRLRALAEFAEGHSEATEQVQLAWFGHGFSGDQAPWPSETWRGELPAGAAVWQGEPPADPERGRIRHLATETGRFWFVYDRSVDPRRPVCVYRAFA